MENRLRVFANQIFTSCIFLLTLTAAPVLAGTYYVSPGGSATWQNATNINTPCSPIIAMRNARAGDIVYFRGGTYILDVCSPSGYNASLQPSNSGTELNPITFEAYPGETPILDTARVNSGWFTNYNIGTGTQDYIIIRGFTCRAQGGLYGGAVYIGATSSTSIGDGSNHCVLDGLTLYGGKSPVTISDNVELIRSNASSYITISNCTVYNLQHSSGNHNTSAMKFYNCSNFTITNNEVYDCTNGIYLKRDCQYFTLSNNYIHDVHVGVWVAAYNAGIVWSCNNGILYNNVIANTHGGFYGENDYAGGTINDWVVHNNTFYNPGYDQLSFGGGTRWNIYNNIFFASGAGYSFKTFRNGDNLASCDHNLWGDSRFYVGMHLYDTSKHYNTLSAWQISRELSSGGNPGSGDIASNPLFVNLSGNMRQLDDFEVRVTSPCIRAGRNGSNIGADISFVGVVNSRSITTDNEPPSIPTGIVIQTEN